MRIEPLREDHDRAALRSDSAPLDEWFHRRAGQDDRRDGARVFVAVDDAGRVRGFYSLSSFTSTIPDLPPELARRTPRYDAVPAALIGRLARDARARGLGSLLLADAVRRTREATRSLAIFAVVVDAQDDRAAAFYEGFGFGRLPLTPGRLVLPTSTAAAAFDHSADHPG